MEINKEEIEQQIKEKENNLAKLNEALQILVNNKAKLIGQIELLRDWLKKEA